MVVVGQVSGLIILRCLIMGISRWILILLLILLLILHEGHIVLLLKVSSSGKILLGLLSMMLINITMVDCSISKNLWTSMAMFDFEFFFKKLMDLYSNVALNYSKTKHNPKNYLGKRCFKNCCLHWSSVSHIHEKHHGFDCPAKGDHHHLTKVHRCIPHVINPHRNQMKGSRHEAKYVGSTDGSPDFSVHNQS